MDRPNHSGEAANSTNYFSNSSLDSEPDPQLADLQGQQNTTGSSSAHATYGGSRRTRSLHPGLSTGIPQNQLGSFKSDSNVPARPSQGGCSMSYEPPIEHGEPHRPQFTGPALPTNVPNPLTSTRAPGCSLTKPVEQRRDSLTKGDITNVSPASSVPPGWKGSRIPSSNVPRKAPLAARSSDEISPLAARKISTAKQERSDGGPKETPEAIRAHRVRQHKSFETPSGIPRRGLPRSDDGSQDMNAANSLSGRGTYNYTQQRGAQPPIGLFAPPQVSSTTTPPKPSRLRPRYTYKVPPELIGTKNAMGPDNWDEYVYLMEQLWTENITAHEFDTRAKPIFLMFDEKMRKKMNNIMTMKMILPRLEELRARGHSTKSADNG